MKKLVLIILCMSILISAFATVPITADTIMNTANTEQQEKAYKNIIAFDFEDISPYSGTSGINGVSGLSSSVYATTKTSGVAVYPDNTNNMAFWKWFQPYKDNFTKYTVSGGVGLYTSSSYSNQNKFNTFKQTLANPNAQGITFDYVVDSNYMTPEEYASNVIGAGGGIQISISSSYITSISQDTVRGEWIGGQTFNPILAKTFIGYATYDPAKKSYIVDKTSMSWVSCNASGTDSSVSGFTNSTYARLNLFDNYPKEEIEKWVAGIQSINFSMRIPTPGGTDKYTNSETTTFYVDNIGVSVLDQLDFTCKDNGDGTITTAVNDADSANTYEIWSLQSVNENNTAVSRWIKQNKSGASATYTPSLIDSEYKIMIKEIGADGSVLNTVYGNALAVISDGTANTAIKTITAEGVSINDAIYVDIATDSTVRFIVDVANANSVTINGVPFVIDTANINFGNYEQGYYNLDIVATGDNNTVTKSISVYVYSSKVTLNYAYINGFSSEKTDNAGEFNVSIDTNVERYYYTLGNNTEYRTNTLTISYDSYGIYDETGYVGLTKDDKFAEKFNIQNNYARPGVTFNVNVTPGLTNVNVGQKVVIDASSTTVTGNIPSGDLLYKFIVEDSYGQTVVQDFSTSAKYDFTPQYGGKYKFIVKVKYSDAGSYEACADTTVTVNGSVADGTVTIADVDGAKNQTPFKISASVSNTTCDALLYKFTATDTNNNVTYTIKDYSPESSCVWIAPKSDSYVIKVSVISENSFSAYDIYSEKTISVSPAYSGMDNVKSQMNLVWSDEFDEDTLNTDNWKFEGSSVHRNGEKQVYCDTMDQGNVFFEDGNLVIEARKEDRLDSSGTLYNYTSAAIDSVKTFKYGIIELRAKLPKGQGVWPAFWMLGYDPAAGKIRWPYTGEIDIFELWGGGTTGDRNISSTLHYWSDSKNYKTATGAGGVTLPSGQTFNDKYHNFGLIWTETTMQLYLDDTIYKTVDISDPDFHAFRDYEFKILVNLAMGSSYYKIADDLPFPQHYILDYVRVYQTNKPVISKVSSDSVEMKAFDGYEYSIDGQNWQSSNVFTGLNSNSQYTVYQRLAQENVGSVKSIASTAASITVSTADDNILYGDANNDGSINSKDSLVIKQYYAEWDVTINKLAADVNADGSINAKDSLLLKQYLAEWPVIFGK